MHVLATISKNEACEEAKKFIQSEEVHTKISNERFEKSNYFHRPDRLRKQVQISHKFHASLFSFNFIKRKKRNESSISL